MFILGTRIHSFTLSQALKKAEGFFYDKKQHYIVTPNPEIVLHASKDAEYRKILNKASLSIPDGTGLLWASRILCKRPLKQRIAGVDFMKRFLSYLSDRSYRTYRTDKTYRFLLLGGRNGVARKTADFFQKKFFNFNFYAIENIENADLDFIIKEIIQPDCLFVALGAPKQEQWINENFKKFPSVKIAMGVGGAFNMISGKSKRAPRILREGGGEWLWRLIIQPSRIGRTLNAAVVFPTLIVREKFIPRNDPALAPSAKSRRGTVQ